MKIDCSIIGLPNVGKSTLFKMLTNISVKIANFPFCTIQPNMSMIPVPDLRVLQLTEVIQSRKITYDKIKFIDVAGLIKGAAQGIGIGNQILNYISTTHILCHVVRCFHNNEITHVYNNIDPCRDISVVNTEFMLFDILQCERNMCVLKKKHRFLNKDIEKQLYLLQKCLDNLYSGIFLSKVQFSKAEKIDIQKLNLLTIKPIIYIANIDDKSVMHNIYLNKLREFISNEHVPFILCCTTTLCVLNSEQNNFVEAMMQYKENTLCNIIDAIFKTLRLCTFFTINSNMTRAWIYSIGTTALEAAKKVHSDFKKGFIRVQVIKFNDFIMYKGELGVKKAGRMYYESKDYCIQDGDILKFLFQR